MSEGENQPKSGLVEKNRHFGCSHQPKSELFDKNRHFGCSLQPKGDLFDKSRHFGCSHQPKSNLFHKNRHFRCVAEGGPLALLLPPRSGKSNRCSLDNVVTTQLGLSRSHKPTDGLQAGPTKCSMNHNKIHTRRNIPPLGAHLTAASPVAEPSPAHQETFACGWQGSGWAAGSPLWAPPPGIREPPPNSRPRIRKHVRAGGRGRVGGPAPPRLGELNPLGAPPGIVEPPPNSPPSTGSIACGWQGSGWRAGSAAPFNPTPDRTRTQ